MNKLEKCDEMTRLVLQIENEERGKAEEAKARNEVINRLKEKLLEVARERTDQMEIPFPKAATGKGKKEDKKAAAGE